MTYSSSSATADKALVRWSNILLLLATITAIMSVVSPVIQLLDDSPLMLMKGKDIWKTTMGELPRKEAVITFFVLMLPNLAWTYSVLQMLKLALYYRRGHVFEDRNTRCFVKIGIGLTVMGVTGSLILPIINYLYFYRGISPWIGDMSWLGILQPDLIMAGWVFFFFWGNF